MIPAITADSCPEDDRVAAADHGAIVARLRALFADDLNVLVPAGDTDLIATGLLDSLALVEMLARVEQEFGVTIEFEELEIENFRSICSIAEFVAVRRCAPTGGAPSP
jgi:acyl carrier protein